MGIIDRIKSTFSCPSGKISQQENAEKNPSISALSADKVNISGENREEKQEINRPCFGIAKEGLELLENGAGGIEKATVNIRKLSKKSGDPFISKMAKLSLYFDKEKSFSNDRLNLLYRTVFEVAMLPISIPIAPRLANFCLNWSYLLDDKERVNTNQDVLKTISKYSENQVEAETARTAKNEIGLIDNFFLKINESGAIEILNSEDRAIQGALRSIGYRIPKDTTIGPTLARTALGMMEGGKNPPRNGYYQNVKVAETFSKGIIKYSKDSRERFLLKTAMRFDYSKLEQKLPNHTPQDLNNMRKNKALRNTLEEIVEGINVPLETTLARIGTSVMLGNYEEDKYLTAQADLAKPFAEAILAKSGDSEIKSAISRAIELHDKLPVNDKGKRFNFIPYETLEKVVTTYREAFDKIKLKALINTPIDNETREDREQIIKILGYDKNSPVDSEDPHKQIDNLISKYALVSKYHKKGDSVIDTASLVRKIVDQIKIGCYENICWDSSKRNRNDYFFPDKLMGKISEMRGSFSAGDLTGTMSVFDGSKEVDEKSFKARADRVTGILRLMNLPSADEPITERAKAMNDLYEVFQPDELENSRFEDLLKVIGKKNDSIPSGSLGRLLNSLDKLKEYLKISDKKEELSVFKFLIDEINKGIIRDDIDSLFKLSDQEVDILTADLKSLSSTAGFDSGVVITVLNILKLGNSKNSASERESGFKEMDSLEPPEKSLFAEDILNIAKWKTPDESLGKFVGKFKSFRDIIKRFRKINEDDRMEFEKFTCYSFGRVMNAVATGKNGKTYEEITGEIEKLCEVFGNPEASVDAVISPEKQQKNEISHEENEVIIGGVRLKKKV